MITVEKCSSKICRYGSKPGCWSAYPLHFSPVWEIRIVISCGNIWQNYTCAKVFYRRDQRPILKLFVNPGPCKRRLLQVQVFWSFVGQRSFLGHALPIPLLRFPKENVSKTAPLSVSGENIFQHVSRRVLARTKNAPILDSDLNWNLCISICTGGHTSQEYSTRYNGYSEPKCHSKNSFYPSRPKAHGDCSCEVQKGRFLCGGLCVCEGSKNFCTRFPRMVGNK